MVLRRVKPFCVSQSSEMLDCPQNVYTRHALPMMLRGTVNDIRWIRQHVLVQPSILIYYHWKRLPLSLSVP